MSNQNYNFQYINNDAQKIVDDLFGENENNEEQNQNNHNFNININNFDFSNDGNNIIYNNNKKENDNQQKKNNQNQYSNNNDIKNDNNGENYENIMEKNKSIDFTNLLGNLKFNDNNENDMNNNIENKKINDIDNINPLDDFNMIDKNNKDSNRNNYDNINKNEYNNNILNNQKIENKKPIITNKIEDKFDPNDFEFDNYDINNNNNNNYFDNNINNNNDSIKENININEENNKLNKQNYIAQININKIYEIDKPHQQINDYENNEISELNKNNFLNDVFFSNFKISKLSQVSQLEKHEKLDNEILMFQVDDILNDILTNNENIINKVKEDIIKYEDADNYTKNYLYNISSCFKIKSLKNSFNEILIYRKVKNEGDSFYISFMFSYLERLILYKKIIELSELIYYISIEIMKPFNYRNAEIKKNEIIIILGMILSSIKKNDINEGIVILNRAFCSNDNFSYGMIKYMKIKIGDFIKRNYKLFDFEEIILNTILSKKYLNYDLKKFNYENYLNNRVYIMQTEPDFFIFLISPLIFNCNLKLFINESFDKTQLIHDNNLNNEINIELIYTEKNFQIAYLNDYYKKYLNDLSYEIYDYENENYDNCIKVFCDNIKCDKCKKESREIILDKILPNFPICQNCLINNINKVLSNRLKYLSNENYNYIEYYTRDIELYNNKINNNNNEDKIIKISNPEFKLLFNKSSTIFSQLIYLMKSSCLLCGNLYNDENDYLILNCNCKLCKNCIGEIILKDTDYKIILTNFEKINLNIKPSICICGNPFDLDNAIIKLYNEEELNKYKLNAKERFNKIILKFCMICLEKNKNKNFYEIEIVKDNNNVNNNNIEFNYSEEDHVLCNNCYINLKEIEKEERKKKDNEQNLEIDCCICNQKHLIILPNSKNRKNKDKKKEKNNSYRNINQDDIILNENLNDDNNSNNNNNEIKQKKKKKKKNNESSCCLIF